MLEIKDNVVISTDVTFVLHDFSASCVVKDLSNMYGRIVIGGNPAKVIGTWEDLKTKVEIYGQNFADIKDLKENYPEKLVKRSSIEKVI